MAEDARPEPTTRDSDTIDPVSEMPLDQFLATISTAWTLDQTITTNRGELTLYAPNDPGADPLVVKQVPEWTGSHVRSLSFTLEACRAHAETVGITPFVAAPHGWGRDPAYLCTDWVDGTNVNQRLADELEGLASSNAVASSIELTTRTAELMAHYHQAMSGHALAEGDLPRKAEEIEETGTSIRLIEMLGGKRAVAGAERVRSIDDPGPHNTIIGADEQLWLIDLPADLQIVMVERDIARLISRVVGAIHRHSEAVWVPYHPVLDAVVEGYERVGSPERRPVDRVLVYACLASDAAIKARLTRRRLPAGTRWEGFVRESVAAMSLGLAAIRLRLTRRTTH